MADADIKAAGNLLISARRGRQGVPQGALEEIGTSGLRQYGGWVLEEWLRQLQGRKAAWVWREMLDNDPTVGAIMFAIRWLARGVDWRVEEGSQPEAAELVESCMDDMSHTWGDFVSEALSILPYGWAYHEAVYKRRQGPVPQLPKTVAEDEDGTTENDDNQASSQYNDGRIGWRKLPVRAQETLLNWEFDGYSGIRAMHQIDYHGGDHIIPIEKSLLFRTQTTRGNPEGRSILRNAFTSYFSLKNVKQFEAIGVERDLAGIPVAKAPQGVDIFAAGQAQLLAKVQAMVTGLRNDEYAGIVLPTGWELELLSSGGAKQMDTDKIVRRYRQDIATSMLADFVLIGQDSVGSFAMVDVKSDLFGIAIDGILDLICEVLNKYAIPRLMALNGMDVTEPPRIEHGSAGRIDLEKVGNFLFQIAGSGAPIPWSKQLLESLFREAGLPANFEEDAQEHVPVVPEPDQDANGDDLPDAQPVGPPMLTPGQEPYARENHLGQPAPQPAMTGQAAPQPAMTGQATPPPAMTGQATPPPAKPAPAKAAQPVKKSDSQLTPVKGGTAIDLSTALRSRHAVWSAHLERDILSALGQLGIQAATAYSQVAVKASSGMLHRLVARVLRAVGVDRWVDQTLQPILQNHAARVIADTQQVINAELSRAGHQATMADGSLLETQISLEMRVADDQAEKIIASASTGLGMKDITPQIRQSIMDAIKRGLDAGENPVKTAERIRQDVPAGRFVNAGAKYRARLIARDQTANLQRAAAAAAYQSNPSITGVRLRDGIFGPPRSDEACIGRDGEQVPIDEADSVQSLHPQCTLSLDPVVSGVLRLPDHEPEPALAAAA